MFRLTRAVGGVLFACAFVVGSAANAQNDQAVNLIVKPKVGRVIRNRTIVKTSFMGMELVVNESQKNTVKAVKTNGDIVVEIAAESAIIRIGGMNQVQDPNPPYSIIRERNGRIKEGRKIDMDEFMKIGVAKVNEALGAFILPEKPVKPNDTWETVLNNPAVVDRKITVKGTYLGLEKIDGKEYWKIKQSSEAIVDVDGTKVTYDSTEWVNPDDGETFRLEATAANVPTNAGNLTLKISGEAVKGDEKDKPAKKDKG